MFPKANSPEEQSVLDAINHLQGALKSLKGVLLDKTGDKLARVAEIERALAAAEARFGVYLSLIAPLGGDPLARFVGQRALEHARFYLHVAMRAQGKDPRAQTSALQGASVSKPA